MRKIEKEMIEAVDSRANWSKDNTSVEQNGRLTVVKLHGNSIAYIEHMSCGGRIYGLDYINLRKWPTRTTMSRLRALGFDVYQRNGKVYHGYGEVC